MTMQMETMRRMAKMRKIRVMEMPVGTMRPRHPKTCMVRMRRRQGTVANRNRMHPGQPDMYTIPRE